MTPTARQALGILFFHALFLGLAVAMWHRLPAASYLIGLPAIAGIGFGAWHLVLAGCAVIDRRWPPDYASGEPSSQVLPE